MSVSLSGKTPRRNVRARNRTIKPASASQAAMGGTAEYELCGAERLSTGRSFGFRAGLSVPSLDVG